MSNLVGGNPDSDFFEQNPELQYFHQVKALIKAVGKERASKLMWAIYLVEDPRSKFYRMEKESRLKEVAQFYLEEPDFDWEGDIKEVLEAYPRLCLSKAQVMFKIWADKMDEAVAYLKQLNFEEDDTKIIRIMEKLGKMWDTFDKVKKKMVEEEQRDQLRGGAVKSFKERRAK